jgi:sulfite exporter TauE/SafE
MMALIGAVLVASLLGSVHCAGMCGAFLAVAVAGESGPGPAALHAAYNLGRLTTYTTLGVIAGSVGAALDLGGSMVGVQQVAAVLAGVMMVGIGVVAILRYSGVRVVKVGVPGAMQRLALKGHRAAAALPPVRRAAAVGLLTTLLPCGWLYAFVITAAGTGSPVWGAATMAAFWVGTLPVMIGLGVGLQALTGPLRRHLPLLTSLLLVGVGLWTVAGRLPIVGMSTDHLRGGAVQRVNQLTPEAACPLCEDHGAK